MEYLDHTAKPEAAASKSEARGKFMTVEENK